MIRTCLSRRSFLRTTGLAFGLGLARPGKAGIEERHLPVRAVSQGPKSHWFGYYDKCPWDRTGRYLLAMETDFCDRQPRPGETATVGMIDLRDGDRFLPLDQTAAWSWQQGTMLQWMPSAPDREIIHNADRDGSYVSIIRDVKSGQTRVIPRPIYAVSPDGHSAVTLDFNRLHRLRPGYGYASRPEDDPTDPTPRTRGIERVDLEKGTYELILPYAWAASHKPDERFRNAHHWYNHLQFNPSGTRFVFLHRWKPPERPTWWTRLYTAKPDGTDVRLLADDGMISHFDWRDDRTLLAWARKAGQGDHFYLFDVESGEAQVLGPKTLERDGHCSYSPDRRWILDDTYPDAKRLQHLYLYRASDDTRIEIGSFGLDASFAGPVRCDLHPRWDRDGTQVCVDSAHSGIRQLYVLDVASVTRPSRDPAPN